MRKYEVDLNFSLMRILQNKLDNLIYSWFWLIQLRRFENVKPEFTQSFIDTYFTNTISFSPSFFSLRTQYSEKFRTPPALWTSPPHLSPSEARSSFPPARIHLHLVIFFKIRRSHFLAHTFIVWRFFSKFYDRIFLHMNLTFPLPRQVRDS